MRVWEQLLLFYAFGQRYSLLERFQRGEFIGDSQWLSGCVFVLWLTLLVLNLRWAVKVVRTGLVSLGLVPRRDKDKDKKAS